MARRAPKSSEPITEQQLSRWKLLSRFIGQLDKHGSRIPPHRREVHGLRDLDPSTYFGLFLFGLFNPVVTSMRALCAATRLNRVSGMLDLEGPVAISGFSDAQHVFSPAILGPVLRVENCRRLGINPKQYLTDVLTRLPGMKASEAARIFRCRYGPRLQ